MDAGFRGGHWCGARPTICTLRMTTLQAFKLPYKTPKNKLSTNLVDESPSYKLLPPTGSVQSNEEGGTFPSMERDCKDIAEECIQLCPCAQRNRNRTQGIIGVCASRETFRQPFDRIHQRVVHSRIVVIMARHTPVPPGAQHPALIRARPNALSSVGRCFGANTAPTLINHYSNKEHRKYSPIKVNPLVLAISCHHQCWVASKTLKGRAKHPWCAALSIIARRTHPDC